MADPEDTQPQPSLEPDGDIPLPTAAPTSPDGDARQRVQRVQRQRQHIEGLTGQDPLRSGIDD